MAARGNTFDTEEIRLKTKHTLKNHKRVQTPFFPESYPIGLTHLLYGYGHDISIKSYFNEATFNKPKEDFDATINLDTWDDSAMYASGCTWIDITKHDRDFQRGKQTLTPTTGWSFGVKFLNEFASDPAVIVWLSGFQVGRNGHWRLKVEAQNPSKSGFDIKAEMGDETVLKSMDVTWIAYSQARSNIDSGPFDTEDERDGVAHPEQEIYFQRNFDKTPRVFFALNKIFASNPNYKSSHKKQNYKLGVKAYVADVNREKMVAHIDAEDEANMDSAAGQWIAIQEF